MFCAHGRGNYVLWRSWVWFCSGLCSFRVSFGLPEGLASLRCFWVGIRASEERGLGLHFFSLFSFASGFTPLGFHVVGLPALRL